MTLKNKKYKLKTRRGSGPNDTTSQFREGVSTPDNGIPIELTPIQEMLAYKQSKREALLQSTPRVEVDIPSEKFVELCREHIIYKEIAVMKKYELSKEDMNIYMLGEKLGYGNVEVNDTCVNTLEMFESLINEFKKIGDYVNVDLLLDVTQKDTLDITWEQQKLELSDNIDDKIAAVNRYVEHDTERVRYVFNDCMVKKNCVMKVHWLNPNDHSKVPQWMTDLHSNYFTWQKYKGDFIDKIEKITDSLQLQTELFRLVTENPVIMSEINNASAINQSFNLPFLKHHFNKVVQLQLEGKSLKEITFLCLRRAKSYYAVARIIKSKMKNVIIYLNYEDADDIKYIFMLLEYRHYATTGCITAYIPTKDIRDTHVIIPAIAEHDNTKFNPTLLGITIQTHGAVLISGLYAPMNFTSKVINKNYPKGVNVKKINDSSLGCYSFSKPMDEKAFNIIIEKTLHNFNGCLNKSDLKRHLSHIRPDHVIRYNPSCDMIEGVDKYYEKIYEKHYIIFSRDISNTQRKQVNIAKCNEDELYNFLTDEEPENPDKRMACKQIIKDRNSSTHITTTLIFKIISIANFFLNIENANILDRSCNGIPFVEPTDYNWRETGIGYGGRKTRRKSFKKRHL